MNGHQQGTSMITNATFTNNNHNNVNNNLINLSQTKDEKSSSTEDSHNSSIDQIPFLEKQTDQLKKTNLIPKQITEKLKYKNYPLEEPKFLEKVKQYQKYEIKSYEVTMLVQVLKNEDKIDIMAEDRLKKKF